MESVRPIVLVGQFVMEVSDVALAFALGLEDSLQLGSNGEFLGGRFNVREVDPLNLVHYRGVGAVQLDVRQYKRDVGAGTKILRNDGGRFDPAPWADLDSVGLVDETPLIEVPRRCEHPLALWALRVKQLSIVADRREGVACRFPGGVVVVDVPASGDGNDFVCHCSGVKLSRNRQAAAELSGNGNSPVLLAFLLTFEYFR